MNNKITIPALAFAAVLSGCAVAPQDTGNELILDEQAEAMLNQLPQVYKTRYFALGIPEGWNVLSFNNEEKNTHITLQKDDRSSTVTVRIREAEGRNTEESCELARNAFDANGLIFESAGVSFGTCVIEGNENEKPSFLRLRNYEDDSTSYSISFEGSVESAGEALQYLIGNEKLTMLTVSPL